MAKKRRTREEWISKANETHSGRYGYDLLQEDVKHDSVVSIICPDHGTFQQTLVAHARGQGCSLCVAEKRSKDYSLTPKDFFEKATVRHNGRYNYSATVFNGFREDVTIRCPEHGLFTTTAKRHLRDKGCPVCEKAESHIYADLSTFVAAAQNRFGDAYSYDNVVLGGRTVKVAITCPTHGDFFVPAYRHLLGYGCPSCGAVEGHRIGSNSQEQFILKASSRHENKYDYSKVVYQGSKVPIVIGCPVHGNFSQKPNDHLTTGGCPRCGGHRIALARSLGKDMFVQRARAVHGDAYDYSMVEYTTNAKKVTIICKKHGEFEQTPIAHFKAGGCVRCQRTTVSRQHKEICDFIEACYDGPVVMNTRSILPSKKELDIWLPELRVAIEFNGLYWHTADRVGMNYHRDKTAECRDQGIRLLHIWEDDWSERQQVMKRHILSVLGLRGEPKCMARKCVVREITTDVARTFLDENHIQGFTPSTVKLGLFFEEELVACATFRHDSSRKGSYVLTRYATSRTVVGGHSKLLAHFERNFAYDEIYTFADLTFSYGDLYRQTGWTEDVVLYPDYRYLVGTQRQHKFGYRLKRFKDDPSLLFLEGATERELAEMNGLARIYDAGKIRFVRKRNQG